ncbi:MAG TPA: lipocalin family protein [Smithellaceae bacterium]|nr:lipocalin family protein [Smithella sp.]HPI51593.1 lipocalin family protein [Smithellaceae bacterium]
MKKWFSILVVLLVGCAGLPPGVTPVDGFQLERYLGKWYEIARLDHSFERGLSSVSAEYSLRPDGGVRVVNRGYVAGEGRWKEAKGRAVFVNRPDQGFLKVSFFGPFYGSYVIMELDRKNYGWALVCGPNRSYLWILARSTTLEEETKNRLIAKAAALGFETDKLIYVRHD